MIFYLWTSDNKFGGYEALLELSKGQGGDALKINLYGWVTKSWRGAYPGFSTARHVVDWNQIPRDVTVFLRIDLSRSKPWVMLWVGHARNGRRYVLNEWPREGDYIPGWGDPGAWALPSETTKQDGDQGPAQRPLGFGYAAYLAEMERIERQLAAWKAGNDDPFALAMQELEKLAPIHVEANAMDSRLGHDPTPKEGGTSTIIDDMNDLCESRGSKRFFEPASGEHLSQGDIMINNALSDVPDALPMAPGLFVARHCFATRFLPSSCWFSHQHFRV